MTRLSLLSRFLGRDPCGRKLDGVGGTKVMDANQANRGVANARGTGDLRRARYERALEELEHTPPASPDFSRGRSMTLDEAVGYALANVD